LTHQARLAGHMLRGAFQLPTMNELGNMKERTNF